MPEPRWLDEREAEAWRAVRDLGQPLWTAIEQAAPAHVESVCRLLIDQLTAEQIAVLAVIGQVVRRSVQPDRLAARDGRACAD